MTNSPGLPGSERSGSPRLSLGLMLLLVLATIGLFLPSLDGALVYDDLPLIEVSPATQSIGAAVDHALEPFWAFNNPDSETQRGVWRPLTNLALAAGRALNGVTGDPAYQVPGGASGLHWISLLLHVVGTVAAFRLATLLIASRGGDALRATLAGACAALLFAWHPAQVEAVSWISAVNDPLWGALGLAGLLAYERSALRRQGGEGAGIASLTCALLLFLALCSKEQAFVLPLVALTLDWSARRWPSRGAVVSLVLPVVLWLGLRMHVFGSLDAGLFREYGDFGLTATREFTFRVELAGSFVSNLFWPAAPAVFRPVHPVPPEGSTALLHGGLWLGGLAIALGVARWKGLSSIAFGLAAAALVFAPFVISPDKAGLFPESDRYLYVAVFGAALTLAGTLARVQSAVPMVAVTLIAAAAFAKVSFAHQARFSSELAFRDAAVLDAPGSPNVRWGAGRAYIAEYERTQDVDMLSKAYLHYLHSLKAVTVYGDGSFVDDESRPLGERVARMEALILETPPEARRLDPTVFATADDRFQATLGQVYSNLLRV
ncbi:MAG: hypothetical protein AAGG01_02700, partial [Planctomycetota bacterium]